MNGRLIGHEGSVLAAFCPRLAPLNQDANNPSGFRLLGHFQCVVDLDAEVTHSALELGVAEQELHRAEILRSALDQGRLGPAH